MYRAALLTCALLWVAGAGARILERCELARELSALGVRPDHLSTWVCIAYHESRFDTNANNPYSGDHGIFQISELYWCGAGKACGLPCSALHDDDITDDLDCALIVHEEHTRLQGNGFLAWVVYPQHCKHNTKKYLVDCDLNSKNSVLYKSREFEYANSFDQQNVTTDRQNVEKLLPPYLSIRNVVRESYGKVFDENRGRTDWYNYKIDNIDDLRLPVFNQPSQHISMPPTTSAPRRTTTTTSTTTVAPRRTTTATTAYVPRVKVWRVIETNQFRKKKKFSEASDEKATSKPEYTTELGRYTQNTIASTAIELPSTKLYPLSIATTPRVTTTTLRPTTKTTVTTTAYRSPTSTFTYRLPSSTTTYRPPISTTTYRPWTSISTFKPFTFTTTYKPSSALQTTRQRYSTTTRKPTTITPTRKPTTTTTTRKPTTTTVAPRTVTTTYRPPTTTTIKPITTTTTRKPTTTWTWSSTTSKKPTVITEKAVTGKPKSDFSWYTFTSRTATTPVTTKLQPFAQTRTTQPFKYSTRTQNNAQTATTKSVTYSTTIKPQTTTQKPKTTQSIFDLYLNPTKAPQLPSYKFSWGESKLKIFAGGTTTTPATTRSNNFTKRQT